MLLFQISYQKKSFVTTPFGFRSKWEISSIDRETRINVIKHYQVSNSVTDKINDIYLFGRISVNFCRPFANEKRDSDNNVQ